MHIISINSFVALYIFEVGINNIYFHTNMLCDFDYSYFKIDESGSVKPTDQKKADDLWRELG